MDSPLRVGLVGELTEEISSLPMYGTFSLLSSGHRCTHYRALEGEGGPGSHLVQPPHSTDKKTKILRDEAVYSRLHDKLVAKPGPNLATLGSCLCTPSRREHLCWATAKKEMVLWGNGDKLHEKVIFISSCLLGRQGEFLSFRVFSHASLAGIAISFPAFMPRVSVVNKMKTLSLIGTSFIKQNERVTEMSKHFPVIWATYLSLKQLPNFST